MSDQKPSRSRWTPGRVLSWFAGLSVGTSLGLVFLTLVALAIFVRTDFFQSRLRDQVVQAVERVIQARISYTEAEVQVFRLFPRISFRDVQLEDEATDVDVSIERVSISISLFYSLPLLAFRKLHISEAEVAGLNYELKNTEVIRAWLDRLRPKSTSVIPARFQTVLQQIRFTDFDLGVSLASTDIFKRSVEAKLHLEEFSIYFSGHDLELNGHLDIETLKYSGIQFENIAVDVENGLYSENLLRLPLLSVRHDQDFILVEGEVEGFQEPRFDLQIRSSLDFKNYTLPGKPLGQFKADFSLSGPLQDLKGEGQASIAGLKYEGVSFGDLALEWEVKYPTLNIKSLRLNDRTSEVKVNGQIHLNRPFQLNVQLRNFAAEKILSIIDPHFSEWRGNVSGGLKVQAQSLGFERVDLKEIDLEALGYKIRNQDQEIAILEVEKANIRGNLFHELNSGGQMNFNVVTPKSTGQVQANWEPGYFMMEWDLDVERGELARLYGMRVSAEGKLPGSYGGPVGEMKLLVKPKLGTFRLNSFDFRNLRGEMRLEDRRLFAAPFEAEGLTVKGGLYFHKEGTADFSDLQVETSQAPLNEVWTLLPLEPTSPVRQIKGKLSGSARFNGWILEPVGQGNILIQDLGLSDDETLGRLAKFNWTWDEKDLRIGDFYLETSKDGGGVRGEMKIHSGEVASAALTATQVKFGDWALLFGGGLQLQSLADFKLNFDRSKELLEMDLELYETIIGSVVQERSRFVIRSGPDEIKIDANLFRDAILAKLRGSRENRLVGDVEIRALNMIPLIKILQSSGLEFPVIGHGFCSFNYSTAIRNQSPYLKLIRKPASSSCELSLDETRVTRADTVLHQVSSFDLFVGKNENEGFSFMAPDIKVRSGKHVLRLALNFSSANDYRIEASGVTGLDTVSYFLPFLSRSEGRVAIDGYFNPKGFTGSVDLSKGMLLFEDSPLIIKNVEASLQSYNSVIDLKNLSGEARDGSITASGRVQLANAFDIRTAMLVVQLNGPLIEPQTGLRFRTSGPLSLKIDGQDAVISGQVSVYDGTFRRRINLRSDLLKIFQPKEEKYQFVERKDSFIDQWRLDVSLNTTEPFVVRNNIADGAVDFDIHLGGVIARPRLSGSITLMQGQFNYNNRNFDLKAGSIQFSDTQSNIPRYDIRAETEVSEYRVFVTFQGDANQQKIIYSSDPPLTEKEILALVSYGTPPGAGDEVGQGDPTESAALTGISFVTGQLQDTIEGALSGDLGIQRFQIYPSFYDETGKTELQLTVGTDLIRNRLELNYSNFLTAPGGHEVQLGFRVNRNVSLVGSWRDLQSSEEQNISGDFGGDIIFRFEFD